MTAGLVNGWVAGGFEPVQQTFAGLAASGDIGEGGAAFAIYHQGKPIVDLWTGSAGDGGSWEEGTRANWASATKIMTSLCVQMVLDRGLIDPSARVADYWPEFGQAGKDAITLDHVLTHRSGVLGSPELTALVDLDTGDGIDDEPSILAAIERMVPQWEPGTDVGYAATTFSWVLGEVIHRVDGRRLGDFFREEVAVPLGCDGTWIGTPVDQQHDIAKVLPMMHPATAPDLVVEYMKSVLADARQADTRAGLSLLGTGSASVLDNYPAVFNSVPGRVAQLGGSNMTATARDVARIAAAIVEPEGLGGVRLASPKSFDVMSEVQETGVDTVLKLPIARGRGYWRNIGLAGRPQACGPNEETVFNTGFGGQIAFADPVARVGGAFVRSHHTSFAVASMLLTNAVYECL